MKFIAKVLIKIYQATLSLDHGLVGKMFPNTRYCRYSPSCSQYTYYAVDKYGMFKGIWMGIKRLSRCHPGSNHPHYDPVK